MNASMSVVLEPAGLLYSELGEERCYVVSKEFTLAIDTGMGKSEEGTFPGQVPCL